MVKFVCIAFINHVDINSNFMAFEGADILTGADSYFIGIGR